MSSRCLDAGNYYTEALAEFQREQAALGHQEELDLLRRQQQELLQHLQRQQVLVQQQEQAQAAAASQVRSVIAGRTAVPNIAIALACAPAFVCEEQGALICLFRTAQQAV